jgi:hypothetical protein
MFTLLSDASVIGRIVGACAGGGRVTAVVGDIHEGAAAGATNKNGPQLRNRPDTTTAGGEPSPPVVQLQLHGGRGDGRTGPAAAEERPRKRRRTSFSR